MAAARQRCSSAWLAPCVQAPERSFGWAIRRRVSPAARRLIGCLGHESGLYLALTAWENLLFAAQMYGVANASERAAELLAATGLKQRARQRVGHLSRGLRQRLAIARAIIHNPPILLLDEPFTSLDGDSRDWLAGFLRVLRGKRHALLIASHDAETSGGLADRVLSLQAGRLPALPRTRQAEPPPQSLPGGEAKCTSVTR